MPPMLIFLREGDPRGYIFCFFCGSVPGGGGGTPAPLCRRPRRARTAGRVHDMPIPPGHAKSISSTKPVRQRRKFVYEGFVYEGFVYERQRDDQHRMEQNAGRDHDTPGQEVGGTDTSGRKRGRDERAGVCAEGAGVPHEDKGVLQGGIPERDRGCVGEERESEAE